MENEPTKEEVDQRARELARKVMSRPYEKQEWGKGKASPPEDRSSASSGQKPNYVVDIAGSDE